MLQYAQRSLIALILCLSPALLHQVNADAIPQWILNPTTDNGITATGCTLWHGSMNLDKQIATARARKELAQQVKVKVQAVDKFYSKQTGEKTQNGFESVFQQVTDEVLRGTKPERIEVLSFDGKKQLCAQVTLRQPQLKATFQQLKIASTLDIDAKQESELFGVFQDN